MKDFPDNIKDTINWWSEAYAAHVAADRELTQTIDEKLSYIRTNRAAYSDVFGMEAERAARLECKELFKVVDDLKVEAHRRLAWVDYLTRQQGCKDE